MELMIKNSRNIVFDYQSLVQIQYMADRYKEKEKNGKAKASANSICPYDMKRQKSADNINCYASNQTKNVSLH